MTAHLPHARSRLFVVLFCTLTLTACGPSQPEPTDYSEKGSPAKGDVYVSASLGDASVLLPWLASDQPSHTIGGMVFDSLLEYDKDLNLKGNLAEKWEIAPDNLAITFYLRKDVKWSDGKPFSAYDVEATFNAITNPNTRTPYAGDYKIVKKLEVLDPLTLKVYYTEPFAPALASWAGLAIAPAHILNTEKDVNETSLKTKPIGTGAYVLTRWQRGQEARLSANPSYFDGEPFITGQRVRVITDQNTQFLELKAARIDSQALTPVQYTRLTDGFDFSRQYAKYTYPSNGYTYLGFNLKNALFADKKVRQALSYATPRQQLIDGVLMGLGKTLCCPFKPGTWAYNTNLQPYPYDIEKAKTLLTEAGWTDTDGDTVRDKNGMPFRFTVVTNQGNDQRIKTAEIMQQAFREVGVVMDIQVQEWSTFINNTVNPRKFEAIILGWSLTPEPDPYDIFHSSKIGEKEFNIVNFANPEADEVMIKARRTFDQAERKKYLDRFQEIINDEQPYLFLYAPDALIAIHKRIKGIEPAPAGIGYNYTEWYVPEGQQLYAAPLPAMVP